MFTVAVGWPECPSSRMLWPEDTRAPAQTSRPDAPPSRRATILALIGQFPHQLTARTPDANLILGRRLAFHQKREGIEQPQPILWINEPLQARARNLERVALDAEDTILPLVPVTEAAGDIPVPRAHLAGGKRQYLIAPRRGVRE